MAQFPAFPLWTDAYLGDTTHLTTIEHGAYLLLLIVAWRSKDGLLPDNDNLLARYSKLTIGQWKKIRPILEPFFSIQNGVWKQGRLIDELEAVRQLSKNQSKKAKARWLKNNDSDIAAASSGHSPSDASPTPTPTPTPKEDILCPDQGSARPIILELKPKHLDDDWMDKPLPPDNVIEMWNEIIVGEENSKRFVHLTENRKKKILLRNKDALYTGKDWLAHFKSISKDSFCMGSKGWTATIDWAIEPKNITKMKEGGYSG